MCFQQDRLAFSTTHAFSSARAVDRSGETDIPKLIGANLRRLRKQRDLTRGHLARLADIETSALRQLERGTTFPSIGMLWKLVRELHVPCSALIESKPQRMGINIRWPFARQSFRLRGGAMQKSKLHHEFL